MTFRSDLSPATGSVPVALPRPTTARPDELTTTRQFLRQAFWFVLIGVVLYLGVYAAAEALVYRTSLRNRFFMIRTAPLPEYDYVFLGASHAAALDYEDMTQQLEQMTGKSVINLSTQGSGPTINRVMLDYFLARHDTDTVVYFIDSFAFYSPEWNEQRLEDTTLYQRAPFDPKLVAVLIRNKVPAGVIADYILGFSKINNKDRFAPDMTDDEATKFRKKYRPIKQIDTARMKYLYSGDVDPEVFQRYLAQFEEMIWYLRQRNIRMIVVKPPIPERIYTTIPGEAEFDAAVQSILERHNIELYDHSLVANDEKFFYNTDHLNRDGVLNYFEHYLKKIL